MKVYHNEMYTASKYAFDTTRKSDWIAKVLADRGEFTLTDPRTHYHHASEYIRRFHDDDYVHAVWTGEPRHLAESQGFDWDANMFHMAVAHTAGVIAAVDHVMREGGFAATLSSGLHHAHPTHGSGFCTFNGLALAAEFAAAEHQQEIVILDLDAHAGGGTVAFRPPARHLDLTISQFDTYDHTPYGGANLVLPKADDKTYLSAVRYLLTLIPREAIVLYNAGVDPNPTISRNAIAERERIVTDHLYENGNHAAATLAGGYTWDQPAADLVALHMNMLDQFAAADLAIHGAFPRQLTRQETD